MGTIDVAADIGRRIAQRRRDAKRLRFNTFTNLYGVRNTIRI